MSSIFPLIFHLRFEALKTASMKPLFFVFLFFPVSRTQEIMPGWLHVFSGSIQCASGRLLLGEARLAFVDGNATLETVSLASPWRMGKWKINATMKPESKPHYQFSNVCDYGDGFQEKIVAENGQPKEAFIAVQDSQKPPRYVGIPKI